MTREEEREELERQKDWVKARLNCDLKAVFERLAATIQHDVKVYNVARAASIDASYDKDEPRVYISAVQKGRSNGNYVELKLVGPCIQVKHGGDPVFSVTPEWDADRLECLLKVEDEEYECECTFPQVSQRAIGGLLFPTSEFPKPRR